MRDAENYEENFGSLNYSEGLISEIVDSRRALGGKTFFERLLDLLKIRSKSLYPPQSPADLRKLHDLITQAPITLHYKHCLIFYLLKDLSPSTHTDPRIDVQFANDIHLEKRFRTFIDGIWDLDQLMWDSGVESLLLPGIAGMTFADEILTGLLRRSGITTDRTAGTVASAGRGVGEGAKDSLPLAYYQCAECPLEDEKLRILFARYLAARSVSETWSWIHTRPEYEHRSLFETLIETVLAPQSHRSQSKDDVKREASDRAIEFVSLPLSAAEDEWLQLFLTEGKGRLLTGADDTVLMRLIATGKLGDVGKEGGVKGRRFEGISWDGIRVGVRNGLGGRGDEEIGGFEG